MQVNYTKEGLMFTTLPNQKCSLATKMTKKWQEDTVYYYVYNASKHRGKRKTPREIIENWNFYNAYLSEKDIKASLDPLGVDDNNISEEEQQAFQFYDILHQPFDTLIGEELKRDFEVRAFAVNPDVVNEKDKEFREIIKQKFGELAELAKQGQKVDEEALKQELATLDKLLKNDVQTAHEKMANGIIKALSMDTKLAAKFKFNNAFKNLEIIGESIYRTGHRGKEIYFSVVDSSNFYVFNLVGSNWIQDAQAWLEFEYMNPYNIIEEFGEYLSEKQVDEIINLKDYTRDILIPYQAAPFTGNFNNVSESVTLTDDREFILIENSDVHNDYVDTNGNIRVARLEFKTLRKLGKLTYLDVDGSELTEWVSEGYVANKELGETIQWFWVQEVWWATLIGRDTLIRVEPHPVQMRSIINPFYVRSTYIGFINTYGKNKATSRLDRLKPYQRMFNMWMNKLTELWAQNIGKAGIIDVSRIPSSMSTEEWFYWLKKFKLVFENPFEEGKQGLAKGQLAGNMQQNNRVIDLSLAQEINQAIQMLNYIEERVNKISAVPEPRQGDMSGAEGLGVSQQAVVQSSHQTEFDYFVHDLLKSQIYEILIEYAKVIYKDEKIKRQFLLDDLSNFILDIDGPKLSEAEFGIKITNSSKMYELYNTLSQLSHAAMQNGTATLTDIARMKMSSTPSEMLMQLEMAEDKRLKQQQEAQQANIQAQQQQMELQVQMLQMQHQMKLEQMKLENDYKMQFELMRLQAEQMKHSNDTNSNQIEDKVEIDMKKMEMQMKEKELALKEKLELKKIEAQKEIAKQKKTIK